MKSYLLTALRHKLTKARQRNVPFSLDELLPAQLPTDPSPEQSLIQHETKTEQARHLQRLMASLTKRQQEILYLRFYQNLDNAEIAQMMNLERQSVANLLHRALSELRENWILVLMTLATASFGYTVI